MQTTPPKHLVTTLNVSRPLKNKAEIPNYEFVDLTGIHILLLHPDTELEGCPEA